MATTFEELGLRPELLDAVEDADYPAPTALQSAAIPVLRRGSNVVLTASPGAGVVACYGLSLLDRILENGEDDDGEDGDEDLASELKLRALVLAPTDEIVRRVAHSLGIFAGLAGLRVLALAPGWATARGAADVVVATPAAAEDALGRSALKLGSILTMVLDAADILLAGGGEAIETVTAAMPTAAQKVVVTGSAGGSVRDYIERHVRRAMRIPAGTGRDDSGRQESEDRRSRRGDSPGGDVPVGSPVAYTLAVESRKFETVARLLAEHQGPAPVFYCRTPARAAELADSLAARGFAVGRPGDADADASIAPVEAGFLADVAADDFAISYDVPADAESLKRRHAHGGLVLAEPRELGHLERIADWAGVSLNPRREPISTSALGELERHRDAVGAAVEDEDLTPHLLVLEPLFERFGAARVAAALNALVGKSSASPTVGPGLSEAEPRGGRAAAGGPVRESPSATSSAGMRPGAAAPPKPQPKGWLRLFVSAGRKDQLRAGDLVGAITGEANIEGDKIGRIDISEMHSIVEIAADVADRVIEALNGTTVKGRSVRVDYDRGKRGDRPSRGSAAERRG